MEVYATYDVEVDKAIDSEALHREVYALVGDVFFGVSQRGSVVSLHCNAALKPADEAKLRKAVRDHDVTKLPPKPVELSVREEIALLKARVAALELELAVVPRG